MTDEEFTANAESDPDARPYTDEEWAEAAFIHPPGCRSASSSTPTSSPGSSPTAARIRRVNAVPRRTNYTEAQRRLQLYISRQMSQFGAAANAAGFLELSMPIPQFLSPSPLDVAGDFSLAGGGVEPDRSAKLRFSIQKQQQDNWCWSAVGVSLEQFYAPTTNRTQCELANIALKRNDCCGEGGSDADKCDKPWYLDRVLALTGNLTEMRPGTLSFDEIQREIASDTPVGCRIGWHGGGGHFVVLKGWLIGSSKTTYIDIADPIYLETQVAYDEFPSSYQFGADWTHTYFTTPATAGGTVTLSEGPDPESIGA